MIVVFPLLVDSSVSPNIIPGVCATLERFALVYKMDYIFKWGGLPLDSRVIGWTKDGLNSFAQVHGIPTAGIFENEVLTEDKPSMPQEIKDLLSKSIGSIDQNLVRDNKDLLGQIDTAFSHGKTIHSVPGGSIDLHSLEAKDWIVLSRLIAISPTEYDDKTKEMVADNLKRTLAGLEVDTKWISMPGKESELKKDKPLSWKGIEKELKTKGVEKGVEKAVGEFIGIPFHAVNKYVDNLINAMFEKKKEQRRIEKERREKGGTFYEAPDRAVKWNKGELTSTISVEPTWITTQSRKGTAIIGVKVVPYPIEPSPFIHRMMQDMSLSFYDEVLERYERSLTRIFATVMRWKVIPKFKKTPIKKDPFEDVIYARSRYAGNIFTLFNLSSLEDEDIFKDAGGVDKLFRLGWKSILVSDDVTKRVMFCMKEFGGVCSVVNYSYLYASLGGTYAKEYGALEDLKKSSSPFFRNKIKANQMLGESYAQKKISRFSGFGIPCVDGDCK